MLTEELQAQIQAVQPDLLVVKGQCGFEIMGFFRVVDNKGLLLDEFRIRINTSEDPLSIPPKIVEVGGRLPQTDDRHVNSKSGTLCYLTPEDFFLWRTQKQQNMATFLSGPLRNYFISQLFFDEMGEWPFGDRLHGTPGRIQFYADLFGTSDLVSLSMHIEKILAHNFKGHHACTCRSNKKIRDCHSDIILTQMSFPSSLIRESYDYLNDKLSNYPVLNENQKSLLVMTRAI